MIRKFFIFGVLLETLLVIGQQHCAAQTAPPYDYQVIDLGTSGDSITCSSPQGINNGGQVVGYYCTNNVRRAFLYSNGSMQDLGTLGGNSSQAYGINSSGQIVGYSTVTNGDFWHAFLYSNGSMRDLGTLGGTISEAYGINNSGQVVGISYVTNGQHAFLYSNGAMQDLGTLGSGFDSVADGINNSGQIVGYSNLTNNFDVHAYEMHAFLYSNGSMQDLGTLGGDISVADGINNSGQIVGHSSTTNGSDTFLYWNGSMQDLGNFRANAINNSGQMVGYYFTNNDVHACLYWNGSMQDLNGVIVLPSSGWVLQEANAINDAGQIVGFGINPSGQEHSFLLNPLQPGALQACTNSQNSLPTYGNGPTPQAGKDSLIVITHGRIPPADDPVISTAWVDSMSNSIVHYLSTNGISNWQVYGCKWIEGAHVTFPMDALTHAEHQGKILGDQIVSNGAWSHIHFIAHSAGAGLIQKATEQIKASPLATIVHCTFLDAYDGAMLEYVSQYGYKADWSDSYFSHDLGTGIFTQQPLVHAYNVDVTTLDPQAAHTRLAGYVSNGDPSSPCYATQSSHGWPIDFYNNTIASNMSSIYEGSSYYGFGFPLSKEAGNWDVATNEYLRGNGVLYGATTNIGPADPPCIGSESTTPMYVGTGTSFPPSSTVKSITGALQTFPNAFDAESGSPVWIATVINDTNALNFVSFDAKYTSATGSHGLFSVYWDTNMVGLIDEMAIQPGFQHYTLLFPNAVPNSSHILGFHLDPFTDVQSIITLTNIVTGYAGVSQPFSLQITGDKSNGSLLYQLAGQPANYTLQASLDLLGWTNIAILVNTSGTVNFVDSQSTNYAFRFYRAVAQ